MANGADLSYKSLASWSVAALGALILFGIGWLKTSIDEVYVKIDLLASEISETKYSTLDNAGKVTDLRGEITDVRSHQQDEDSHLDDLDREVAGLQTWAGTQNDWDQALPGSECRADQLRERACAHLGHQTRAINLDRARTDL